MKTIRQWFIENLSTEDCEKAIKYTAEDVIDTEVETFNDALIDAFVWDDTEEGVDYWDNKINIVE